MLCSTTVQRQSNAHFFLALLRNESIKHTHTHFHIHSHTHQCQMLFHHIHTKKGLTLIPSRHLTRTRPTPLILLQHITQSSRMMMSRNRLPPRPTPIPRPTIIHPHRSLRLRLINTRLLDPRSLRVSRTMCNLSFSRSFFVAVFFVGERGVEWDFISSRVEDEVPLGVDLVFFF
jgi:hypothetical protein